MKYAFFDVDNTVYQGYTASEIFLYMHRNKLCDPKLFAEHESIVQKYSKREIDYAELTQLILDITSASLKGYDIQTVSDHVKKMLTAKTVLFNEWTEVVFAWLKSNDFSIYLISAGPDVVISQIASILKTDGWFATEMEQKDGIYTGFKTQLLNDELKLKAIRTTIKSKDDFSVGFGDSPGDIPMLESVNQAFVARNNDHKEILTTAEEKGWFVFKHAEEVIPKLKASTSKL